MHLLRILLLASLCLGLSGCGFSLRSNDVLTTKFSVLHLQLEQPNSELSRLLQSSLEIASVATAAASATDAADAIPVLHVGAEQLISRPVSVNPPARAAQYELRMSVDTSLAVGSEILLQPETLLVERSYFEDIENIVGTQEELAIIAGEMRRELVNQLLRRLESLNI